MKELLLFFFDVVIIENNKDKIEDNIINNKRNKNIFKPFGPNINFPLQ